MSKLGLVTVLYKSDEVLEDFFKSVSLQDFADYHLYLIDNSPSAQTDNLINDLIKRYPIEHYSHVKNSQNEGVAKGNNQGIELALKQGAENVILLNNDITFSQPHLFKTMVDVANKQKESLIIPKIFYHGSRVIWMAGGKLLKYKGYTIHIGENKEDPPECNQSAYFDYAPTCFMLINRVVFNDIGIMDEDYFVYFDDTDFIYRAVSKNYKVYYLPELEVTHKVSNSTGGNETLFSIYYVNRNRLLFIRKNLKNSVKIIALTYSLITRLIKLARFNNNQRQRLIKAIRDGLTMSV